MPTKLQEFSSYWERETDGTLALMRALPGGQYDFRPDAGGRSIGELAWHLAEVDAYVTFGIEQEEFNFDRAKPKHIERPRALDEFASAFRVVHLEAVARVAQLTSEDWDREIEIRRWRTLERWRSALAQAVDARDSSPWPIDTALQARCGCSSSFVRSQARGDARAARDDTSTIATAVASTAAQPGTQTSNSGQPLDNDQVSSGVLG
jgi:uncharacterized damage-inducible protein DinB